MELQTEANLTATDRTEVLVEALRKIAALQGLSDEEYRWLAEHGRERFADAGTVLPERPVRPHQVGPHGRATDEPSEQRRAV